MLKTELGKCTRLFIAVMAVLEFILPLMVLWLFSRKLARESAKTSLAYLRNFIQTEPKEIVT